jgi:hypothetical protein
MSKFWTVARLRADAKHEREDRDLAHERDMTQLRKEQLRADIDPAEAEDEYQYQLDQLRADFEADDLERDEAERAAYFDQYPDGTDVEEMRMED